MWRPPNVFTLLAVALGSASLGEGCTDLPAIPRGACGNAVVERWAGEDCDTFSAGGSTRCAPPGATNQCRFTCGPVSGGERPECPSGMACGTDDVCRSASGAFAPTAAALPSTPRELLTGDLDGDGRTDLLESMDDEVLVHYLDGSMAPTGSLEMPSQSSDGEAPLVAELTADDRADVVLPSGFGVVAMIGTLDRTTRPSAHPGVSVRGVDDLALGVGAVDRVPAKQNIVLGTVSGLSGIAYVPLNGKTDVLGVAPGAAAQLSGPMVLDRFDERSTCDSVVLSYRDDQPLLGPPLVVFPLCTTDGTGKVVLNHTVPTSAIDTGGAHIEFGARALDVDRDGHLDLVLGVLRSGKHEVDVAYGLGDGTFSSTAGAVPPGDGRIAPYGTTSAPVKSVAFLDDDAILDFVTATEIRVSRGGSFGSIVAATSGSPFVEVLIDDVNASGTNDVAALTAKDSLELFANIGNGLLVASEIPLGSPASILASGDVDGDGVRDLLTARHLTDPTGRAEDSVSVLFGRPLGVPERPVSVGLVDPLSAIVTRYGADSSNVIDGTVDFNTVSKLDDGTFAFYAFQGRSDRALRSPYAMVRQDPTAQASTPVLAGFFPYRVLVGELTGDDHPDLVAIAHPDASLASLGTRLCLTPCTGEARLLQAAASFSDPLSTEVAWTRSLDATIDLDGDGRDEVVTLAPLSSDPTKGVLVLSAVTVNGDGTYTWVVGEPVPMDFTFERIEENGRPEGEVRGAALKKADVDGDGRPDLVALGFQGSGSQRVASVLLFPNRGDGTLGPPLIVPSPGKAPPDSFALIQADADVQLEIAVLGGGAAYIAGIAAQGEAPILAESPVASLAGADLVAAGDFDGDGVDDLALSGKGQMALFRGAPETP